MDVNPDSLDFGMTVVGTTSRKQVEISNVGGAPLFISGLRFESRADVSIPIESLLTTDCAGHPRSGNPDNLEKIDAGECASFVVEFTPNSVETLSTGIVITSNSPNNSPFTLPVAAATVSQ